MCRQPSFLTTLAALVLLPLAAHAATVTTFTGGDVGEGLDLDGTFVYAFAAGRVPGTLPVAIRDANFTDGALTPGVTLTNTQPFGSGTRSYGASTDDNNLESIMEIVYLSANSTFAFDITLANLTAGSTYLIQLIYPNHGARTFNVAIDGGSDIVVDWSGNPSNSVGTVLTETFVASASSVLIHHELISFPQDQPILGAVTLKEVLIPEPASLGLIAAGAAAAAVRRRRR